MSRVFSKLFSFASRPAPALFIGSSFAVAAYQLDKEHLPQQFQVLKDVLPEFPIPIYRVLQSDVSISDQFYLHPSEIKRHAGSLEQGHTGTYKVELNNGKYFYYKFPKGLTAEEDAIKELIGSLVAQEMLPGSPCVKLITQDNGLIASCLSLISGRNFTEVGIASQAPIGDHENFESTIKAIAEGQVSLDEIKKDPHFAKSLVHAIMIHQCLGDPDAKSANLVRRIITSEREPAIFAIDHAAALKSQPIRFKTPEELGVQDLPEKEQHYRIVQDWFRRGAISDLRDKSAVTGLERVFAIIQQGLLAAIDPSDNTDSTTNTHRPLEGVNFSQTRQEVRDALTDIVTDNYEYIRNAVQTFVDMDPEQIKAKLLTSPASQQLLSRHKIDAQVVRLTEQQQLAREAYANVLKPKPHKPAL